jgi:hypothetical protein
MKNNIKRRIVQAGLVCVLCLIAASCVYAKPAGQSQLLDDGIVRFYAEGANPEKLPPSLALVDQPKVIGSAPKGWTLTPDFTLDKDGRYAARVDIQPGTSLYGTGEVMGPLLRNGSVIECWNRRLWLRHYDKVALSVASLGPCGSSGWLGLWRTGRYNLSLPHRPDPEYRICRRRPGISGDYHRCRFAAGCYAETGKAHRYDTAAPQMGTWL